MLRISAGKYKNKRLKTADNIRPIRERIKLAVFSILGEQVYDAKCLDLFAGSGSLGFEALSRGAKKVTLIDDDFDSIKALNSNLITLGNPGEVTIIKDDSTKYIVNDDEYYDIIFLDPPYDQHIRHIFKFIHENLMDDGLIVYFHSSKNSEKINELNNELKTVDTRKYGTTSVDFISRV